MMSNLDRLVYMANQIARNFEALGQDHAVEATADHIASFWDPRMKAQIFKCHAAGGEPLQPIAYKAVALLVAKGAPESQPESQMAATVFTSVDDAGGSDAR
jgi:NADH-dependant formate dehydrogenase delta subunit FdsD.